MTERSYTVQEIDALRSAVGRRRFQANWRRMPKDGSLRVFIGEGPSPEAERQRIEDEVRTYMLAGVTAADVRAAELDDERRAAGGAV